MEFVSMQTYKGKYDWKQELRIGTFPKFACAKFA